MRRLLSLTLFVLALVVTALAFAGPASQPASAPVVAPALGAALRAWWAANWYWVLTSVILPSVIVGLRQRGTNTGVLGFVEALLERLSVVTASNSPGTFKLPFTSSKPPQG